jgi:hypothetical protein
MKITNNKQHEIAVREINDRIKAINDYLGEGDETKLSEPYLIRIPPGYIRTADEFRAMLEIPITSQLKTNVAYHLILSDLCKASAEVGLKLVFFNGDFKSNQRVSQHFSQNEKRTRKAQEVRGHYQGCKTSYQALIQS